MKKWYLPLAVFLAIGSLTAAGLFEPIERSLMDQRFHLFGRDASRSLVVVEIDPQSISALDGWPLARELHAEIVDRLHDAGAGRIAFVVDFSEATTPSSDQAFAAALKRSGGRVILPSITQSSSADRQPLPAFRVATLQGIANIDRAPDGIVRQQRASTFSTGTYQPTIPVLLAGGSHPVFNEAFYLDYSINIGTVPRLSYADLLNGNFDTDLVAGKNIIIGTAVAARGGAPVPNGQIFSPALVQALAYESLVQGRTLQRSNIYVTLLVALVLTGVVGWYCRRHSWPQGVALGIIGLAAIQGIALATQWRFPISVDTAAWMGIIVLIFATELIRKIEEQAVEITTERSVNINRAVLINSVFEGSFEGIIVTGSDGKIEFANAAAAEVLGLDTDRMAETSLDDILPRPGDPIFAEGTKTVQEGNDHVTRHNAPVELELKPDNGEQMIIELILSESRLLENTKRSKRDTLPREINVYKLRDITGRKRNEEALKTATVQAQEANRAKSEFLANMSHELRTPLNAIIGFSEVIREQTLGPVGTAKYIDYAGDIERSGHHLLAVISDILDISKVESGAVTLTEEIFDLDRVLRSTMQIIAGTIAGQPKKVSCDIAKDLPPIYADPRLIRQIGLNLLSNAIKFTKPDGTISLRAFLDDRGQPTIEVSDNGVGIDPDLVSEVTKPFYQVEGPMSRTHGGAGLGLALVASHVEMHGGTMGVESAPGKGTTITIHLPASRVRNAAELAAEQSANGGDKNETSQTRPVTATG
ncbi:MAG: CHASE2 domain-containing protein [Alphaproteobacteria bacterium]|nr:CHASE2 domain-containing protein [Alphaproteobacteria bacterium]